MLKFAAFLADSFFMRPGSIRSVRAFDILVAVALQVFISLAIGEMDGANLGVPSTGMAVFLLAVFLRYGPVGSRVRAIFEPLPWMQYVGLTGVLFVYMIMRKFGASEVTGHVMVIGHGIGLVSALVSHAHRLEAQADLAEDVIIAKNDEDEMLRRMREFRVEELGPSIGIIQDHAIPAWVKLSNGKVLPFKTYVGQVYQPEEMEHGDVIIVPGLLYGEGARER